MRLPRPASEPASSASVAAIAAIATLSFAPVSTPGIAAGASTIRNVCQRDAPNVRMSLRRSASTRSSASSVGTTIGKKQTSATIASFGVRPKPHQATSSGAMSTIGIVCEPTSSGYSARRRPALKWIAIAQASPRTIATSMPRPISPAVTVKLLHSRERSS